MVKSIKIVIAGKEYTLKGDDEQLILRAANDVNTQLTEMEKLNKKESAATLAILTALNIAEENWNNKQTSQQTIKDAVDELILISDYLNKAIVNG
jgi:cell division protein ZapA (FtsZ GTPase activity inhibitor)